MSTNDGGPAFPVKTIERDVYEQLVDVNNTGISIRDYMAAKAMQAIVGSYRVTMRGMENAKFDYEGDVTSPDRDMIFDKNKVTGEFDGATEIAADAYRIADAMLAAREDK